MAASFRPYLAVLALTLLAGGAAAGLNRALAVAVAVPDDRETRPVALAETVEAAPRDRSAPASPPVPSKRDYVRGILQRNIFDHTAIGKPLGEGEEAAESDLEVHVLATLVAVPEVYSSALIALEEGKDAFGYAIGDTVLDAEIVAIEKGRIQVRRTSGELEYVEVSEPPKAKSGRVRSKKARTGKDEDGIERIDANRYAIDRSLVDKYMNDLGKVSRLGRARPHRSDGKVDGYRLYGIRRNSLGRKLGIRNGDIVRSVNGHELTSMQEAMAAFQALQTESSFTFEVTRRGKDVKLEYDVR